MTAFWELNISNITMFLSYLMAGVWFVSKIKSQMDNISERMLDMEGEIKKLIEVLVQQGRHSERLNALDARLNVQSERINALDIEIRSKASASA